MPRLTIRTSAKLSDEVIAAASKQLSTDVAAALEKDEKWMMIEIVAGLHMRMAGDAETPVAACEIVCIGHVDIEHNTAVSAAVAKVLETMMGVPKTRYYCTFNDYARENIGYNGVTFGNLQL